MYGIPDGTTAIPGNELGIFQSLDDVYAQADLDNFFSMFTQYVITL